MNTNYLKITAFYYLQQGWLLVCTQLHDTYIVYQGYERKAREAAECACGYNVRQKMESS